MQSLYRKEDADNLTGLLGLFGKSRFILGPRFNDKKAKESQGDKKLHQCLQNYYFWETC